MGYSRNELTGRVFEVADRLALENGSLAVGIDAVHRETGGGRDSVTKAVNAWKAAQRARVAHMPNPLRLLAVRIAEEAWALANIALGSQPPPPAPDGEPPRSAGEKPQPVDRRPFEPERDDANGVALGRPGAAGRPAVKMDRKFWSGAHDREFAMAVAEVLSTLGHPLFPRELESCSYPPSTLPGYDPKYPGRAIEHALAGSRIGKLRNNMFWFVDLPAGPRPRQPAYKKRDTENARKREESRKYVAKAVRFIERNYPKAVHFSEIWRYLNSPDGYTKSWLRHALGEIAKTRAATFKLAQKGTGQYRAKGGRRSGPDVERPAEDA